MTKWLNPDATTADLGEGMQAYYDEKLKVWVFPGEDPAEKAKPIGPPPMTPAKKEDSKQEEAKSEAVATPPADPLAAMMAPPRRPPSSFRRPGATPGAARPGAPPTFMMPPGASPAMGAKTMQPPPQFKIFKPKDDGEKKES